MSSAGSGGASRSLSRPVTAWKYVSRWTSVPRSSAPRSSTAARVAAGSGSIALSSRFLRTDQLRSPTRAACGRPGGARTHFLAQHPAYPHRGRVAVEGRRVREAAEAPVALQQTAVLGGAAPDELRPRRPPGARVLRDRRDEQNPLTHPHP